MKRQISFIKNKSKRIISLGVCLGVLGITFGIGASAGTYSTVSNGRIAYDADEDGTNEVLFDASDISNMSLAVNSLQDNISTLTTNYAELIEATETGKNSIVTALNGAALTSLAEGSSYAEIVEAIEYLQNVPEGATLATADNISSGYAAIVPGTGWIVGNGADNDTYYAKGYADGYAKIVNTDYTINYVHHVHSLDSTSATITNDNADFSSVTATYSDSYVASSSGGCFTTVKYRYHSHSTSCYGSTNNVAEYWARDDANGNAIYRFTCRECGATWEGHQEDHDHQHCPKVIICGKSTSTIEGIAGYTCSCGKTAGQVIEVNISLE